MMGSKKNNTAIKDLEEISRQIRGTLIGMSHKARAPHLGSALSCIDILIALHWKVMDNKSDLYGKRDKFIISKGHAASALYAALAFNGMIPMDLLDTYCEPGSDLEEHPGPRYLPGVEAATGSLGHGLSLGAGIALADRLQKQDNQVFVVISDGECNEGSVWEAAMYASGQNLKRLCAIIDFNKWQATGRSCEVTGLEPLVKKWEAFGWHTLSVDGHNMKSLVNVLKKIHRKSDRPTAVIAHTVKGKGVSFMEDDNNWHYKIPSKEEVFLAKKELGVLKESPIEKKRA
ncbi:MAG: transketolase [Proteobacteria bacterium]|nr:transketolase [Pseudomonadota bacterium]MBU1583872.1 transketolase [Pseudomonadota bacterium]MBU2453920.1 transketolase [Pseudomonadota bacterium]MBU2628800.1 transketolase [Pseudomonadota bacterium]